MTRYGDSIALALSAPGSPSRRRTYGTAGIGGPATMASSADGGTAGDARIVEDQAGAVVLQLAREVEAGCLVVEQVGAAGRVVLFQPLQRETEYSHVRRRRVCSLALERAEPVDGEGVGARRRLEVDVQAAVQQR